MSVSWYDAFILIKDKLVEKLTDLEIDGDNIFEDIYVGRKSKPTKFPCVFVWPEPIRIVPATTQMSKYYMPFTIRVVSKMPSLAGGFADALLRIGEVEKMLVADRKLETTADNTEVSTIVPDVILPKVLDRHEAELIATFLRKL